MRSAKTIIALILFFILTTAWQENTVVAKQIDTLKGITGVFVDVSLNEGTNKKKIRVNQKNYRNRY